MAISTSNSPTPESSNNKVYLPIPPPDGLYSENPQEKLTEIEQEHYDVVFSHFNNSEYKLPGYEDLDKAKERLEEVRKREGFESEMRRREWTAELVEEEKFWLSYECILRYLRASKWKSEMAIERLENTLNWRREFGIYDLITNDYISIEGETGKAIIFGYDVKGRPTLYMIPSRQNTEEGPRQIHYTVWLLERCIDLMPPGVENLAIMLNFAANGKNTSLSVARTVLNILQDHYPERMGITLIIQVPFIVNLFFKMILPKLKFNPNVIEDGLVEKEMLVKEWWGGEQDLEYVHEKFFKALVDMGEGRVGRWMGKWRELGGRVGVKEWDYKRE
ncbi:hypothetical protein AGABI1DRAFT_107340 [Agaricus bisporus var. burnettii JB137-S8]|uniref:CRAL-TRIO domain-containing protein n=1 Tax=Agaricus bisporus var. burnettii (strain JB137-S8 / ATCC MYA-4627 / FGSC 10392) TaxID=597362 RepID=K5VWN7_AGABU|nr:uncharacterized protein AGABI1DRAFT_107340 [Agaricus bisporus var. burnettii JB137-S8]EKM78889.1 hypothetical protein AGABI1DRAFT_107340 [Agaricus bisporus var. burnettii JB137-S8]